MKYYSISNSQLTLSEKVNHWKTEFIKKFGNFNYINIQSLEEIDNNTLIGILTSSSFLNEKKLILIKINQNKNEEDEKNKENKEIKNEKDNEKINLIIKNFDKIPEENIVLFYELKPDKRSKIFKFLKENSKYEDLSVLNDNDLIHQIQKKYNGQISNNAIIEIIKYKSGDLSKIYQEIEKLLITKNFIEIEDINNNIFPELEESIFQIIDSLLFLDKKRIMNKINIILEQINIYAFFNSFLSNIRIYLYILKYKNIKINSQDIIKKLNLGNRGFLVNKNIKISFQQLKNFNIGLINIDKKMKTGKIFQTDENGLKLEIEKLILKL